MPPGQCGGERRTRTTTQRLSTVRVGEVLVFGLVGNARIDGVRGGVDQLLASRANVPPGLIRKVCLECDDPLPIGIDIHIRVHNAWCR